MTTSIERRANTRLRALLEEAGWSNGQLARAVIAAAARSSTKVGTTRTSVSRWLDGAQPHWPMPRLVAAALGHRLGRLVSVNECGFRDTGPGDDPYTGLRVCPTLDGTVRTIIDLAGRDMLRRRTFLGAGLTAGVFTDPILAALLDTPTTSAVSRSGGTRHLGQADVQAWQDTVATLRRQDQQHGAHRIHDTVVTFLHREGQALLNASFSTATGRALYTTLAQAAALAAWTAGDIGHPELAQRYFTQAFGLANHAADTLYAANLLAHMARHTAHIGDIAPDGGLAHARDVIRLARAGRAKLSNHTTPGLTALLATSEARGHALRGDDIAAREAINHARRAHDTINPSTEPSWLVYRTPGECEVDLARLLRDTGHADQAAPLFTGVLATYPPEQNRRRGLLHIDIALNAAARGDLDHAAHSGLTAVSSQHVLESAKGRSRLTRLHYVLAQQPTSATAELQQRLATTLQGRDHARAT